jgi:two-component system, response regulator YesN
MLKLLIADDEYLVLDSIKMIVSKNVEDIEIVATASTGREAIEKAVSLKPDIVFMDIHMPGINGIEAIRQIKNVNSNTVFVIISAYEYFDYAKEALNLGVIEYLLKPINKGKLLEIMNNIRVSINNKRHSLIKEIELKEKMDKVLPSLEAQFISDKLFNIPTFYDIEFYENIFSMKLKKGYAMMFLFENTNSKGNEDNLKVNHQKQSFYDGLNIKLKSLCSCLIGQPMSDRIIVYIPVNGEEHSDAIRERALDIGRRIIAKTKGLISLKYRIGIGRPYDTESFEKSCSEAYKAAANTQAETAACYEEVLLTSSRFDIYPLHKENAFSNSILTANFKDAREAFLEIYLWLSSAYREDVDKIKSKVMDLLYLADKNLPYKLSQLDSLKQGVILNVLKTNDKDELRMQFLSYLSDLAIVIQDQKKADADGIIPMVLQYLNNNYQYNISLNDVAKNVNLSYHYLSKVFKDQIGKSFIDFLTELRLEKSMKLLANQSMSIKEICQEIGYNDPNYYCKVFKKLTGMTPTEYRIFINGGSGCID